MMKAFERHLEALASLEKDAFREKVQERWGRKLPKGLVEELSDFIVRLPRVERRVFHLWTWLQDDSQLKKAGSHFLTYMYQPDDFIPETEKSGLFGYIDDAYIAALFYEHMIDEIRHQKSRRLTQSDTELYRRAVRFKRKAGAVIPEEAIRIKLLIADLYESREEAARQLFSQAMPA